MVLHPDSFLEQLALAGSDSFLVHWEHNANLHRTIGRIKSLGKRAGVAINPASPASFLEETLPLVDEVLVMTVDPGFGHQPFLPTTLPKIRRVRRMIDESRLACELGVDGGIDETTAPAAVAAGADVLVAGTAVFATCHGVLPAVERLRAAVSRPRSTSGRRATPEGRPPSTIRR